MLIIDDSGMAWEYNASRGRIECLNGLAESVANKDWQFAIENGYYCDDLFDGIRLLEQFGYIDLGEK